MKFGTRVMRLSASRQSTLISPQAHLGFYNQSSLAIALNDKRLEQKSIAPETR